MKRLDMMDVKEEPCIPIKDFRIAFPKLYKEVLEEGRRWGYAQAKAEEEERLARMEGRRDTKSVTIPRPVEEDKETKKKRLIKEYKEGHPGVSLKDATLVVGKAYPSLFR